jgi:hypothetical protein
MLTPRIHSFANGGDSCMLVCANLECMLVRAGMKSCLVLLVVPASSGAVRPVTNYLPDFLSYDAALSTVASNSS